MTSSHTPATADRSERSAKAVPEKSGSARQGFSALLVSVVVSGAVIYWIQSIGGISVVRERYGETGLLISAVVHAALNLTPAAEFVPSGPANGAIWGFGLGSGVNWVGWMAASWVQFLIARRTLRDYDLGEVRERLPVWLRRIPVDTPLFQIVGRSLPWLGNHIVNVASGALQVPPVRFLWCAALGLIGPSMLMAGIGAGILSLF